MQFILKARNYTLQLNRTYVMGILNVTPDSFSDGNKYFSVEKAIQHAIEMEKQGADIIDIGAQSTRPGYERISFDVEWNRLKDVILKIRKQIDIPISVDTFYPEVAKRAINLGADIINDVTGFRNKKMFELAKKTSCGCMVMSDVSLDDTPKFFSNFLKNMISYNICKQNVCFDPGIGFGKSYSENLKLLYNTSKYCPAGYPILIGASRKRVVGTPAGNPEFVERLPGTIAAHTLAISSGANIIRVHEVKESKQAALVADAIIRNG